jgi:phosphatidylserine decarboxylase
MNVIYWLLLVICLFLSWRFVFFFRNPNRVIIKNPDHILSPADGFVAYIREVSLKSQEPILSIKGRNIIKLHDLMALGDQDEIEKGGLLIGIFMSPFDVHYNRTPIAGRIRKIAHEFPRWGGARKNLSMFNTLSNLVFNEKPYIHDSEYVITNERASYLIKNEDRSVYVTQIADQWVNKIVTHKDGVDVEQGEVFGLIRMGSQVDVYVPSARLDQVLVAERKHVLAGKTVLIDLS